MKTLRLFGMALSAILLCISFNSCSDDDDGGDAVGSAVVGKWNQTTTYTSYYKGKVESTWTERSTAEFRNDGTALLHDHEYYRWSLTGNTMALQYCHRENDVQPDEIETYTYKKSGSESFELDRTSYDSNGAPGLVEHIVFTRR